MLHSSALRPFLEATHSFSRQRVCRYSHMGTPPLSSLPPSGSTRPTSRSHLKATVKEGIPTVLLENRSAFVKTWDFLKNPAEALALIRAVEQKYGPVESFRFQKVCRFHFISLLRCAEGVNVRTLILRLHTRPKSRLLSGTLNRSIVYQRIPKRYTYVRRKYSLDDRVELGWMKYIISCLRMWSSSLLIKLVKWVRRSARLIFG